MITRICWRLGHVPVEIRRISEACGVFAQESTCSWRIVSGSVEVKADIVVLAAGKLLRITVGGTSCGHRPKRFECVVSLQRTGSIGELEGATEPINEERASGSTGRSSKSF